MRKFSFKTYASVFNLIGTLRKSFPLENTPQKGEVSLSQLYWNLNCCTIISSTPSPLSLANKNLARPAATKSNCRKAVSSLCSLTQERMVVPIQVCSRRNNSYPRSLWLWKNCYLPIPLQVFQLWRHYLRRMRRKRKRDVWSVERFSGGKCTLEMC